MNNTSRYIANLYLVMLNVRDTLEFVIDRDHNINAYKTRKRAIQEGIKEKSALRNFLDNNGDKGKEIAEKIQTFLDDVYGDDSTVLMFNNDTLRVDHTQHIKIYEYVVGINETLRDVINSYLAYARKKNELEDVIVRLIGTDEALYRSILFKFVMLDLEKSFAEFNKVMNESKGQTTPQSNYIVQNEIVKYASYLRFARQHCHLTDNKTLDLLDEAIQILEMTEGRRQRRDNKSFNDIFKEYFTKLDAYIKDAEIAWKDAYKPVFEEMIQLAKEALAKQEANKSSADNRQDN